jgi:hypothetical protein
MDSSSWLQNAIHPLFAKEKFIDASDGFYHNIAPALQLATRLVTEELRVAEWIRNSLGCQAAPTSSRKAQVKEMFEELAKILRFHRVDKEECTDEEENAGINEWIASAGILCLDAETSMPLVKPKKESLEEATRRFFTKKEKPWPRDYWSAVIFRSEISDLFDQPPSELNEKPGIHQRHLFHFTELVIHELAQAVFRFLTADWVRDRFRTHVPESVLWKVV